MNAALLTKTRNALPGWDVKPSPAHPEMMRCFRPAGASGLGGITFDVPSVEAAKRAARVVSEVG